MDFGINKSTLRTAIIVIVVLLVINTAFTMFPALAAFKSKLGLS